MKYMPTFPAHPFDSVEAAREWVDGFVAWYNVMHRHSGIQFVTPAERHSRTDTEILRKRKAVYEAAKERHPERWSRNTRNWDAVGAVWLNPDNLEGVSENLKKKAA